MRCRTFKLVFWKRRSALLQRWLLDSLWRSVSTMQSGDCEKITPKTHIVMLIVCIFHRLLQGQLWLPENTNSIRNVFAADLVVRLLATETLMLWLRDRNCIGECRVVYILKVILKVIIFLYSSGQCYKRQMQPLQKTAGFPFARKPHSIRLVEVPGGQKGIKLSQDVMLSGNSQCFTISE